jgi:hypothetical protein
MTPVRMTTKPQQALERSDGTPVPRRNELRPVGGVEGVDADRRRSVREELDAAEERFPTVALDDVQADAHEVVEAINRLGSDAARVLQTVDVRALELALPGHVDEKA